MSQAPQMVRDPDVIAVFVAETDEALQRLETMLMEAERGQPRADMLDHIFRDVHSLKGNAGYLGYDISRSIAHATEDLLSTLHERHEAANAAQCAVLWTASDQLRQIIANIKASSEEGALDVTHLIASLHAATQHDTAAFSTSTTEPQTLVTGDHNVDAHDGTVRINLATLDKLMNLTGELVLAGNQMTQVVRSEGVGSAHHQAVAQRLAQAIAQTQEQVLKTRMQPVARLFDKLPRMVRDLAKGLAKQVSVTLHGTATELDRAVIDAMRDPLMHIVRNAVDHGLEAPTQRSAAGKASTGSLRVSAAHTAGMVVLSIEDDGRGIDAQALRAQAVRQDLMSPLEASRLSDQEAIELIFRSGFSTAAHVTDISGRGVGMDVVRTQVEKAGGHVEINTEPGRGTRICLKLPLTLAVIPAMLVGTGTQRFALPQVSIVELVAVPYSTLEQVCEAWVYRLRGQVLPLVRLDAILGLSAVPWGENVNIVVTQALGQLFGLVVECIDNTEDIIIKPLDGVLKHLGIYAGATTLANGGVALVLDAAGIATRAGTVATDHRVTASGKLAPRNVLTTSLLTFRAGRNALCAVPLTMVARLEEVPSQSIEHVADRELLHYRGRLLPIVRPEVWIPLGAPTAAEAQPVVVLDLGQLVGIAVSEILDVVEVPVADAGTTLSPIPYVLEQRVYGSRTTLVLDVMELLRATGGSQVLSP